MVRAAGFFRSSAIGRLIRHLPAAIMRLYGWLCGLIKSVAHSSTVLNWTDRAKAWKLRQRDRQMPQALKRFLAAPSIKPAARWVTALLPALILLTGDQERPVAVLIALFYTAWAASNAVTVATTSAFDSAFGRWLALLLVGSAFSLVFGGGDVQYAVWYEWIFWWLVAWLAYQSGRYIVGTQHFGTVLAGLGILCGALAVYQKITGYGDVAGWVPLTMRPIIGARATGFFGNPNTFASAINLLMWPLATRLIDLAVGKTGKTSVGQQVTSQTDAHPAAQQSVTKNVQHIVQIVFYVIGLIGLALALLLTRSRAAMLGAIGAAAIMIAHTHFFRKLKARPGFWVAFAELVLLIALILIPIDVEHMPQTLIKSQMAAWQGRLVIWKEALILFCHSPLSGGGPGSLSNIVLPGGGQAYHAHNMLLQWLAETGLFQTLILLLFIIWYSKQIRKRVAHLSLLCGFSAAIAAILIQGLFDYPLAARPIGMLWWVWIGFGLSLARHNSSDEENPNSEI